MSKQNNSAQTDKDILRQIKKENYRLRFENFCLKNEIKLLKEHKQNSKEKSSPASEMLKKQAEREYLFSKNNYCSYLFSLLRSASIFKIYSSLINAVKKYTFITTSLRIFAWLLLLIQSSAVFVISASTFLISLPLTLFVSYMLFFTTFLLDNKALKRIKKAITERKVYIFFPPKGSAFNKTSYIYRMAHEFSTDNKSTVIIVSPYFLKAIGTGSSKKLFFTMREEDKGMMIIRKHYYFLIKNKLLKTSNSNITEIY